MPPSKRADRALRAAVGELLSKSEFGDIPPDQRVAIAAEAVWMWASKQQPNDPNKGQPWTDDALRVILQQAPVHENIYRLARAFGRSFGSVEQIYRWAATSDKEVKAKREHHTFILQIKRIAKEVGWEAF